MSALFNHKKRPFQSKLSKVESDDESLDDGLFFGGKKQRAKKDLTQAPASGAIGVEVPHVTQEIVELDDSPQKPPLELIKLGRRETAKRSTKSSKKTANDVVEIFDEQDIKDPKLRALLQKQQKKRLATDEEDLTFAIDDERKLSSGFFMPTVASAAQRLQQASQLASAVAKPAPAKQATETPDSPGSDDEEDIVNVRTRLNGAHEHMWRVKIGDSFAMLTRRVNNLYGLPPGKLSLVFEGDKITPEQTPASLELEAGDDVLIEAKLDAALYEKAVACAGSKGA